MKSIAEIVSVFSSFLKEKIPSYANKDISKLVTKSLACGGFFTAKEAILGMAPRSNDVREVLFLAANNKEGRKQVMREAIEKLNPKQVVYTRTKHNGREFVRGPAYWERLVS